MKAVIGFSVSSNGLYCSDGKKVTENYLDFLLEYAGDLCCFADLDSDVARLLRLLNLQDRELERLADTEHVYLSGQGWSLTYFPQAIFAVKYGAGKEAPETEFFDASAYDYSLRHLPEGNETALYSLQRAQKAAQTGQLAKDALAPFTGDNIPRLSSPGAAMKPKLATMGLPNHANCPEPVTDWCRDLKRGDLIQSYRIGAAPEGYDYDLVTAYGYQLSNLLDLRRGTWRREKSYQANSLYGVARCKVTINADFSPIVLTLGEDDPDAEPGQGLNLNYNPTGTWERTLLKNEIAMIYKYGLGEVEVLDGWWWSPSLNQPAHTPFKGMVSWAFGQRQKVTEKASKDALKRMPSSIYGLQLEERFNVTENKMKPGVIFCPFYARWVETSTRLQVWESCQKWGIVPLNVSTDGILTDKPIPIPEPKSPGDWKLSHGPAPAIVVNDTLKCVKGKTSDLDGAIEYDWLMAEIQDKPKADSIKKTVKRVVKLRQAVVEGRIEELGLVKARTVEIPVSMMQKRQYPKGPKYARDLVSKTFESKAWSVNILRILNNVVESKPLELVRK